GNPEHQGRKVPVCFPGRPHAARRPARSALETGRDPAKHAGLHRSKPQPDTARRGFPQMSGVNRGNPMPPPRLALLWQSNLDDHVISLAWSVDGKKLACAAVGGPVRVFDGRRGASLHNLSGHGFGTTCVAWSGDGAHLASAGQDGKVKLWDLEQNRERLALPGGAAWVDRLAWCPVVNVLASAAGRKLRLWDPTGKLLREFPDHPSTIADIAWQPRAEILASAAYG